MICKFPMFITVLLVCSLENGNPEKTYTFTLKNLAEGDRFLMTTDTSEKATHRVTDENEKVFDDGIDVDWWTVELVQTIVKKKPGDDVAQSLSRTYKTAKLFTAKDKKTLASPLQGKTVSIQLNGDEYDYCYQDGSRLATKDAEGLEFEFKERFLKTGCKSGDGALSKRLFPRNAVKLNDSWTVDAMEFVCEVIGKQVELFDVAKAKSTGKLVEIYRKDNSLFAKVVFLLDANLKIGADIGGCAVQNGKTEIKAVFDGCVDGKLCAGKFTVVSDFHYTAVYAANGWNLTAVCDSTSTFHTSWAETRK